MTDADRSFPNSDVPAVADPPPGRVAGRAAGGRRWIHAAVWTLFVVVTLAALWAGLALRHWTWQITADIHFLPDITRGYAWGLAGSGPDGLLNLYDKMAAEERDWNVFLDYAPLRLAVMTLWAGHNRKVRPDFAEWRADYAFNTPVLWFNTGMELIGVFSAFFLVRRVVLRARQAPPALSWPAEWRERALRREPPPRTPDAPHPPFAGWAAGLTAALLLWFNPTMVLSAHAWPTWDMWVVPLYLLALLAAVYDRWWTAGLVLAIGVMFKGQQLVGAPVFLAWTLLNGRWRDAARFVCGGVVGVALVGAPWLLTRLPTDVLTEWYARFPGGPPGFADPPLTAARAWNVPLALWAAGVLAAMVAVTRVKRLARPWSVVVGVAAAALLTWPLLVRHDGKAAALVAAVVGAAMVAAGATRWADRLCWATTAAAVALLSGVCFFGASSAWWYCGITYGTTHYHTMVMGFTDNLAGLLTVRFGWNIDDVWFTLPASLGGAAVTTGLLLRGLFVAGLLPCLWAVARHARRGDPKWLVAVVTPWLVFFALAPQIHERYLLYAAAIGSVLVGQGLGMTLLALVLTLLAWMQTIHVMLHAAGGPGRRAFGAALHDWLPKLFDPTAGRTLYRVLVNTFPDAGWAVLLATGVFLYQSVRRTRSPADFMADSEEARR